MLFLSRCVICFTRLHAVRDHHIDMSSTSHVAGERRDADVMAAAFKNSSSGGVCYDSSTLVWFTRIEFVQNNFVPHFLSVQDGSSGV